MKLKNFLPLVLAACALNAYADPLVYTNGPVNGTINGRTISGYLVSDSFTVTSDTTLSSAVAGLWTSNGAPTSLEWSIGTTEGGSQISSGTATSFSSTPDGLGNGYYPIYESQFAITGSVDVGTTYYFSLQNAAPGSMYWDINNGASAAFQNGNPIASESFQLYGSGSSVPDGGTTVALLGAGLVGLGALRRRFIRA